MPAAGGNTRGVRTADSPAPGTDERYPLPAAAQRTITGKQFFPDLISGPFHQGLVVVFAASAALAALAALASLLRGSRSPGSSPDFPGG